ncbi:mechanosensitive ion channel domain-containing protein [Salinisphaera sp. SPP-AMP-43]|uniref:mechanosensitive ion channel family protein n=1 Tax=Salinisphaera sp. SPP-AMP-43 TaxID=3121288 RepID=UPI003C6E5D98
MALWLSLSAHAQIPSSESPGIQSADVVVNGEVVFPVRGISAFPAGKRARQIAEQIVILAKDNSFSPDALTIRDTSWGSEIDARGHRLFTIVDADVALQGPGIERRVLAETYRQRIAEVIRDYRRDRTPRVLLANLGRAVLILALLAGVLFVSVRGFRWLEALLERHFKQRLVALENRTIGSLILQAEQLWQLLRTTLKLFRTLLAVLAAYVLVNIVLGLFPWTRQLSLLLLDYLITPLLRIGTAVLDYIPSLVFLLVLIWIVRYAIRVTRLFFAAVAHQRLQLKWFEAEWAWPTYRIVRAVLILVAIILAYPYIPGSGSDAFKGVSILIGVLFSLGSTSVIANIIAGYTMTYRRAFRVGDRIRIEQTVGDVTDIRVLVTHLRSLKNEEVILPNSKILNSDVVNYSSLAKERGLLLHTTVGIGYDVSWRQVEAMLLSAADRTEGLLRQPRPFVLQQALGDFAVSYELNVYCDDASQMMQLYTALHRNIQDVFNEHSVQIMTPHYMGDTPEPKFVPKDEW